MKQKNIKIISGIIILLILVQIAMSIWIIYEDNKQTNVNLCIIGNSCEQVQDTKYSEIFGIKLSYIGLGAFIILFFSFFINKKIFFWFSLIGACFAIYLMFVQFFILKQLCSNCLIIDVSMLVIFGLTYIRTYKSSRLK
jgi:uncharacterized membrane protein